MLKERYDFTDDNGYTRIITVDEILESYDIKGLTLSELQEKYVNTVDEYDEKIGDMEDKYEELNSNFSSLRETIVELSSNIEQKDYEESQKATSTSSYIIIFIIGIILAFIFGRLSTKKEEK